MRRVAFRVMKGGGKERERRMSIPGNAFGGMRRGCRCLSIGPTESAAKGVGRAAERNHPIVQRFLD